MRHVTVAGKLWYCVSQFFKTLLDFVTMKRLLSKLINRGLLTEHFAPIMDIGAGVHTNARRRLIVGNPGMNGSRHSVGMAVLEALAARLRLAES